MSDPDLRTVVERLCQFETTDGNEAPAATWFRDLLADNGFETYEWEADPDALAAHSSFPDDPADIDAAEQVVRALQHGMETTGLSDTDPRGATYGADSRHYVAADIPTVVFGPGSIDQAHLSDESIRWPEVEQARATIAATAESFLTGDYSG